MISPTRRLAQFASSTARDGLTLLEIVISASLLGVLAMAVSLLIVPFYRQARLDRELGAVARAAEDALESLRIVDLETLRGSLPRIEALSIAGEAGELELSALDPSATPLHLRVTVRWESAESGACERVFHTARME